VWHSCHRESCSRSSGDISRAVSSPRRGENTAIAIVRSQWRGNCTARCDLKEQLKFKGTLERINGHVFVQGDDDEICSGCAESDLKPIHLIPHHSTHAPYQKAWCPKCKTEFHHNVPYTRALATQANRMAI
jgi:hypothetical protein